VEVAATVNALLPGQKWPTVTTKAAMAAFKSPVVKGGILPRWKFT
jgi:hypothetical protein